MDSQFDLEKLIVSAVVDRRRISNDVRKFGKHSASSKPDSEEEVDRSVDRSRTFNESDDRRSQTRMERRIENKRQN